MPWGFSDIYFVVVLHPEGDLDAEQLPELSHDCREIAAAQWMDPDEFLAARFFRAGSLYGVQQPPFTAAVTRSTHTPLKEKRNPHRN